MRVRYGSFALRLHRDTADTAPHRERGEPQCDHRGRNHQYRDKRKEMFHSTLYVGFKITVKIVAWIYTYVNTYSAQALLRYDKSSMREYNHPSSTTKR